MVNSWSLAWEVLNGTMDETYPIREDVPEDLWGTQVPDIKITSRESDEYDPIISKVERAYEKYYFNDDDDGLDYETNYYGDYMADVDDQYSHHFTTYDDGMSLQVTEEQMSAHYFKYHEKEILKDIEEYVSRTYQGHYTGKSHEYRNVQTLDLMAAKELASGFCQANILKYGSRYGNKDGRNTKDLMKVIHYAMLLLHFDGHYGKPSMSTGNIDDNISHQMP